MKNLYGKEVIIKDKVNYIGKEENPIADSYLKAYAKALKEVEKIKQENLKIKFLTHKSHPQ